MPSSLDDPPTIKRSRTLPIDPWEAKTQVGGVSARSERLGLFLEAHPYYFDETWYREVNGDVAASGIHCLTHYITDGAWEGRSPNEFFNASEYIAQSSEELDGDTSPLEHYVAVGWLEGRLPSDRFDVIGYISRYPDVAAAMREPLGHYLQYGRLENRSLTSPVTPSVGRTGDRLPLTTMTEQYGKLTGRACCAASSGSFDPEHLSIDWLIPDFRQGAGGHMAIFKAVYWLEARGHDVTIWLDYPNSRSSPADVQEDIVRFFKPVKARIRLLTPMDILSGDVLVVTDRWTVWSGRKHGAAKATLYFVQDYEPYFFGRGAEYLVAEETYGLGLFCFCSSPWLARLMRERGSEAEHFLYPADREFYFPLLRQAAPASPSSRPLIALYARSSTARRAVELAIAGLIELKAAGVDFTVALFGQVFDENQPWPFAVEFRHVLSERDMGELFRRADVGIAFSATNYSITVGEMMACGLPVVDIDGPQTREVYPEGAAQLVRPVPLEVARALQRLLEDGEMRARQVGTALAWSAPATWPDVAARFESRCRQLLEEGGWQAAPRVARPSMKASVFIEGRAGSDDFEAVIRALERQDAPFEHEVECLDNAPDDATRGERLNAAFARTDGDVVVVLAAGAEPIGRRWLFDLVGLLQAIPTASCAFGRHEPRPDANPFLARDIVALYDLLRRSPHVVSEDLPRSRIEGSDADYEMVRGAFSLANGCIRREAWTRIPAPRLVSGLEDVWPQQMLAAGYKKVFVDAAAISYSPARTASEIRAAAWNAARLRRTRQGRQNDPVSAPEAARRLAGMNRADLLFGITHGLGRSLIEERQSLNVAEIDGLLAGQQDW